MKRETDVLTPLYSRLLLRLTASFPNFDVAFVKPLRAKATQSMRLLAGNRVLDVGCGTGGSFPFLVDAVGPTGKVLGVEISPATVVCAQRRIETNGWTNVQVVQAPAQSVQLEGPYDGLIMFAAPDVYASAEAFANILPHLRIGARIALFGAKTVDGAMGKLLNPLLRLAVSKLSFETTPLPDAEPWHLVKAVTEELKVSEHFFGSMFLADGSLSQTWEAALKHTVAAGIALNEKAPNPSIVKTNAHISRKLLLCRDDVAKRPPLELLPQVSGS